MIDYQRLFHTGVRVPDLDKAMAELGTSLGLTWATPREQDLAVWTPQRGVESCTLRYTYSVEGAQHIELIQGPPGSIWHAGHSAGVHHVGVWVDNVAEETGRLVDQQWDLIAAHLPPAEGFGIFTYLAPPSGLIVELVAATVRPRFEAWWSGNEGVVHA